MSVEGPNRRGDDGPPSRARRNHKTGVRLAFTISSDYEQGREVQDRVLAAVADNGFAGHTFFAIKLALEEALVNAIKHGNRFDTAKKVKVSARVSRRRVEIEIEDEGPGFDRSGVPDPTADENIEKCSGRGILLIESYMSRVIWDRGGRRLRMTKENDRMP